MISRRAFLAGGAVLTAAGAIGLPGCSSSSAGQTAVLLPSTGPLPERFTTPFAQPPVKQPQSTELGVVRYELVQRVARAQILPDRTTPIMGYDGLFPGPTILARRGQRCLVTIRNELAVPTVTHLHGGHTPAESDGYPTDLVLPRIGAERFLTPATAGGRHTIVVREHDYPNDQPAATLWYHDHRLDFTAPAVWRGLAGAYVIADPEEADLGLPDGDHDLLLMIMDRSFAADGSLRYPSMDPEMVDPPGVTDLYGSGVLGDVLLVNGRPWPVLAVDPVRYRFRIINASNARRYGLGLDPAPPSGAAFVQIGSDAGLLRSPVEHQDLTVAPGERFEVVVDFAGYPPGSIVTMTNALGVGSTDAVMRFRVGDRTEDRSRILDRLAEVPTLDPAPGTPVREFRFLRSSHGGAHWLINGQPFDPARVDARIRLGATEIWRFYGDLHHPVHVHLSPFQVIGRGGRSPGPADRGWKDTVDLRPTEFLDVAIRFTDHAGRFLVHCHNLEHEDMMMMSAFETVA